MRRTDEVNDIGVLGTGHANEEVVGFDVAVDEGFLVDRLDTRHLHHIAISDSCARQKHERVGSDASHKSGPAV